MHDFILSVRLYSPTERAALVSKSQKEKKKMCNDQLLIGQPQ